MSDCYSLAVEYLESGLSLRQAAKKAGLKHSTFYRKLKIDGVETGQSIDWYKRRFLSKITKQDSGCWEWNSGKDVDGYGQFSMNGRNIRAHRAAYLLFIGEFNQSLMVRHSCDNPACCNPGHLSVGTALQNAADALERNRYTRGERQHLSKLSAQDVFKIRAMSAEYSYPHIAKIYRVSASTVRRAVLGITWSHIKTNEDGE